MHLTCLPITPFPHTKRRMTYTFSMSYDAAFKEWLCLRGNATHCNWDNLIGSRSFRPPLTQRGEAPRSWGPSPTPVLLGPVWPGCDDHKFLGNPRHAAYGPPAEELPKGGRACFTVRG